MKMGINTAKLVDSFIKKLPAGETFASAELLKFGSRANIDKVLSRLVKAKKLVRVARGIFLKQEKLPYCDDILPAPSKIAETVARVSGETITIHGAEAARQLELTTQVQTKPIFLTSGPTRHIKVADTEIYLKHVAPRKLANSNNIVGLVVSALWYLGRDNVSTQVISKIKSRLTEEQFMQVEKNVSTMPSWMANAFYNYKREHIYAG